MLLRYLWVIIKHRIGSGQTEKQFEPLYGTVLITVYRIVMALLSAYIQKKNSDLMGKIRCNCRTAN